MGGILPVGLHGHEDQGYPDRHQELQQQLAAPGQPKIAMTRDLGVVISKSDGGIGQCSQDSDPYEAIAEIGPK